MIIVIKLIVLLNVPRNSMKEDVPVIHEDPTLTEIGKNHKKTPAQVHVNLHIGLNEVWNPILEHFVDIFNSMSLNEMS